MAIDATKFRRIFFQAKRGNTSTTNLPNLYANEPGVEDNVIHDLDLDDGKPEGEASGGASGTGNTHDANNDSTASNEDDEEK